MNIRVMSRCMVGILALILLVPGCSGCKKAGTSSTSSQSGGGNSGGSLSVPEPGGVVQNVRGAAVRTFTLNEMKQLALWYQICETSGMAANEATLAQDREMASIAKAVKDGDLIVNWPPKTTASPALLAYPKDAAKLQSIPAAFCDGSARNVTKQEFATLVPGAK